MLGDDPRKEFSEIQKEMLEIFEKKMEKRFEQKVADDVEGKDVDGDSSSFSSSWASSS